MRGINTESALSLAVVQKKQFLETLSSSGVLFNMLENRLEGCAEGCCQSRRWLPSFTVEIHLAQKDVMQTRPATRQVTFLALRFQAYNKKEKSGIEFDHSNLL